MKKYILFTILFFASFIAYAQCNGRYNTEIFQNTTLQTVTYSPVTNLDVDIYMGDGDTELNRPLVILAHGGSFITGSKTNPLMVSLAETLAKRGYVVASMSYRIMSLADITQPEQYIDGVVKGMNDGRAAIRYFYKSAENGNPYAIDTNQIYFCGNSAGGVIGLHAAFLDNTDNPTGDFLTALTANGGIEGNAGNSGYSSNLAGMISLAGGIADVNFITSSDTNTLLISAHGDADEIVPFNCGQPLGNTLLPQLCGGGAIKTHSTPLNYTKHFHSTYVGDTHCPWNSNVSDETTVTNFVLENLYNNLPCSQPIGVTENGLNSDINIYPNPAQSSIHISSTNGQPITTIDLYSTSGQFLFSTDQSTIDIKHLEPGIYFLKIQWPNSTLTTSVVKQ